MSTTRPRVLVVDDEATTRLLIRAALTKAGFDVSLASGGEEALRQFRAGAFDLIMLDVEMPDMSGHDVCAAIRGEAGVLLPIVMVTGMDDVESIAKAYHSGATDFIAKPLNPALIGHRVRYLLRAYQALLDLRVADARNAAVLQAIPDSLFEVDIDGTFVSCHSPHTFGSGQQDDCVAGKTVSDVLPPEAAAVFKSALESAFEKGASAGAQYVLERPQGPGWFELSVARKSTEAGERPRFIVLSRDISERKATEERIARLAFVDSLTGLPNRHSFLERVDREIGRADHASGKLAVLFMDLDGFKNVNDTMGHSAGDLILQWAAERLREGLRPSDAVSRLGTSNAATDVELARLGGDEFTALVLDVTHVEDALAVAHRIGQLMRRPFTLDGRSVTLTTSCGVALYPDDGQDGATLLKHADTAMYHAKNSGRDNTQLYSVSLTAKAMQRLELDASLRVALDRNEFELLYQPQFDVASGRIDSVEALVRWRHPQRGLVSPLEFVPMAEENGLIERIGQWVLRTACVAAAAWCRAGHRIGVAVNLSPVQFNNPGLVQLVVDTLVETGLDPSLLELEITESALMENSATTVDTLRALRQQGVRIALDDFGTGYSSLGYLTRMPISNLKVDRCFVTRLIESSENQAIVRAVVAMAGSLGMRVTAEGVETIDQARALMAMDCHTLQGYFFSRPIPAAAVMPLLNRRWMIVEEHDEASEPSHPSAIAIL